MTMEVRITNLEIGDEIRVDKHHRKHLINAGRTGVICDKTDSRWIRVRFPSGYRYWYMNNEVSLT